MEFKVISSTSTLSPPVSVLIVDDSAVIRGFLRRFLEESNDIKVTATVSNGEAAIKKVENEKFDVIILDIEMPVMDGLTALPIILEKDPDVHVIMASTLTQKNAAVSFQALQLGATECLPKPSSALGMTGTDSFRYDIVTKTKELAVLTRKKRGNPNVKLVSQSALNTNDTQQTSISLKPMPAYFNPAVIAIGSSTGGPKALTSVFSALKGASFKKPIFITQHMPEKFTTILAENLAKHSGIDCHEGIDGEEVRAGVIYVAPGNYHMCCKKDNGRILISLNQAAPENFCRPSVDPMIKSLTSVYGGQNVLGVMLTGMGHDGLGGYRDLVDNGGVVFAQDEDSSVVWGMPGAVAENGLCSKLLPLEDIPNNMRNYL